MKFRSSLLLLIFAFAAISSAIDVAPDVFGTVAFTTNKWNGVNWHVYVMELSNPSVVTMITRSFLPPGSSPRITQTYNFLAPVISPDGKRVVFYTSYQAAPGDTDLWEVDLATMAKRRLTGPELFGERDPAFTPDGQFIIVAAKANAADQANAIWKLSAADGGATVRVQLAQGTNPAGGDTVATPVVDKNGLVVYFYVRVGSSCISFDLCASHDNERHQVNLDGTGHTVLFGIHAAFHGPMIASKAQSGRFYETRVTGAVATRYHTPFRQTVAAGVSTQSWLMDDFRVLAVDEQDRYMLGVNYWHQFYLLDITDPTARRSYFKEAGVPSHYRIGTASWYSKPPPRRAMTIAVDATQQDSHVFATDYYNFEDFENILANRTKWDIAVRFAVSNKFNALVIASLSSVLGDATKEGQLRQFISRARKAGILWVEAACSDTSPAMTDLRAFQAAAFIGNDDTAAFDGVLLYEYNSASAAVALLDSIDTPSSIPQRFGRRFTRHVQISASTTAADINTIAGAAGGVDTFVVESLVTDPATSFAANSAAVLAVLQNTQSRVTTYFDASGSTYQGPGGAKLGNWLYSNGLHAAEGLWLSGYNSSASHVPLESAVNRRFAGFHYSSYFYVKVHTPRVPLPQRRGMYVEIENDRIHTRIFTQDLFNYSKFIYIIDNHENIESLMEFVREFGINALTLYDLRITLPNEKHLALRHFIGMARANGVIWVEAVAGGLYSHWTQIADYQNTCRFANTMFSGAVSEIEWWWDVPRDIENHLLVYFRHMKSLNPQTLPGATRPFYYAAYCGWVNNTEIELMGAELDMIFLHAFWKTASGLFGYTEPRVTHTLTSTNLDYAALISAEGTHHSAFPTETFLGDWLLQNSIPAAENQYISDFNALFAAKRNKLIGFQWYSYPWLRLHVKPRQRTGSETPSMTLPPSRSSSTSHSQTLPPTPTVPLTPVPPTPAPPAPAGPGGSPTPAPPPNGATPAPNGGPATPAPPGGGGGPVPSDTSYPAPPPPGPSGGAPQPPAPSPPAPGGGSFFPTPPPPPPGPVASTPQPPVQSTPMPTPAPPPGAMPVIGFQFPTPSPSLPAATTPRPSTIAPPPVLAPGATTASSGWTAPSLSAATGVASTESPLTIPEVTFGPALPSGAPPPTAGNFGFEAVDPAVVGTGTGVSEPLNRTHPPAPRPPFPAGLPPLVTSTPGVTAPGPDDTGLPSATPPGVPIPQGGTTAIVARFFELPTSPPQSGPSAAPAPGSGGAGGGFAVPPVVFHPGSYVEIAIATNNSVITGYAISVAGNSSTASPPSCIEVIPGRILRCIPAVENVTATSPSGQQQSVPVPRPLTLTLTIGHLPCSENAAAPTTSNPAPANIVIDAKTVLVSAPASGANSSSYTSSIVLPVRREPSDSDGLGATPPAPQAPTSAPAPLTPQAPSANKHPFVAAMFPPSNTFFKADMTVTLIGENFDRIPHEFVLLGPVASPLYVINSSVAVFWIPRNFAEIALSNNASLNPNAKARDYTKLLLASHPRSFDAYFAWLADPTTSLTVNVSRGAGSDAASPSMHSPQRLFDSTFGPQHFVPSFGCSPMIAPVYRFANVSILTNGTAGEEAAPMQHLVVVLEDVNHPHSLPPPPGSTMAAHHPELLNALGLFSSAGPDAAPRGLSVRVNAARGMKPAAAGTGGARGPVTVVPAAHPQTSGTLVATVPLVAANNSDRVVAIAVELITPHQSVYKFVDLRREVPELVIASTPIAPYVTRITVRVADRAVSPVFNTAVLIAPDAPVIPVRLSVGNHSRCRWVDAENAIRCLAQRIFRRRQAERQRQTDEDDAESELVLDVAFANRPQYFTGDVNVSIVLIPESADTTRGTATLASRPRIPAGGANNGTGGGSTGTDFAPLTPSDGTAGTPTPLPASGGAGEDDGAPQAANVASVARNIFDPSPCLGPLNFVLAAFIAYAAVMLLRLVVFAARRSAPRPQLLHLTPIRALAPLHVWIGFIVPFNRDSAFVQTTQAFTHVLCMFAIGSALFDSFGDAMNNDVNSRNSTIGFATALLACAIRPVQHSFYSAFTLVARRSSTSTVRTDKYIMEGERHANVLSGDEPNAALPDDGILSTDGRDEIIQPARRSMRIAMRALESVTFDGANAGAGVSLQLPAALAATSAAPAAGKPAMDLTVFDGMDELQLSADDEPESHPAETHHGTAAPQSPEQAPHEDRHSAAAPVPANSTSDESGSHTGSTGEAAAKVHLGEQQPEQQEKNMQLRKARTTAGPRAIIRCARQRRLGHVASLLIIIAATVWTLSTTRRWCNRDLHPFLSIFGIAVAIDAALVQPLFVFLIVLYRWLTTDADDADDLENTSDRAQAGCLRGVDLHAYPIDGELVFPTHSE